VVDAPDAPPKLAPRGAFLHLPHFATPLVVDDYFH